jgi:elongation factor Tu
MEYESEMKPYAHTDWPGHGAFVKNMMTSSAQMDGASLVLSASDGPTPQTREHIVHAPQVGLPNAVGFMNKVDLLDDLAPLDLVQI